MKQSVKTVVRLTVIAAAVAGLSACGGGGGGGGGGNSGIGGGGISVGLGNNVVADPTNNTVAGLHYNRTGDSIELTGDGNGAVVPLLNRVITADDIAKIIAAIERAHPGVTIRTVKVIGSFGERIYTKENGTVTRDNSRDTEQERTARATGRYDVYLPNTTEIGRNFGNNGETLGGGDGFLIHASNWSHGRTEIVTNNPAHFAPSADVAETALRAMLLRNTQIVNGLGAGSQDAQIIGNNAIIKPAANGRYEFKLNGVEYSVSANGQSVRVIGYTGGNYNGVTSAAPTNAQLEGGLADHFAERGLATKTVTATVNLNGSGDFVSMTQTATNAAITVNTNPDTARYQAQAWHHADVQTAFNAGWTGKGIEIQVIDNFATNMNGRTVTHGEKVREFAQLTARGANVVGINTENTLKSGINLGTEGITNADNRKVINLSIAIYGQALDQGWRSTIAEWTNNANGVSNINSVGGNGPVNGVITGATPISYFISKAAGNTGLANMQTDALNEALKSAPNVVFVGATDSTGNIASYSTRPGTDAAYQQRFLVTKVDNANNGGYNGTSFAAPIVAGYGAIVMHKFNNMNGSQTADILLKTAKKDFVGYDVTKHGQGEASLSRALSPIGRLR